MIQTSETGALLERAAEAQGGASPSETPRDRADALYRAAVECCRQRERYARLVDSGAGETEQKAALKLARYCDDLLRDAVGAYEKAAGRARGAAAAGEPWWHKANTLWMACREYERRHRMCDEATKRLEERTSAKLGELALDYDLEASAVLALKQAIQDYRKCRPDAELFPSR